MESEQRIVGFGLWEENLAVHLVKWAGVDVMDRN